MSPDGGVGWAELSKINSLDELYSPLACVIVQHALVSLSYIPPGTEIKEMHHDLIGNEHLLAIATLENKIEAMSTQLKILKDFKVTESSQNVLRDYLDLGLFSFRWRHMSHFNSVCQMTVTKLSNAQLLKHFLECKYTFPAGLNDSLHYAPKGGGRVDGEANFAIPSSDLLTRAAGSVIDRVESVHHKLVSPLNPILIQSPLLTAQEHLLLHLLFSTAGFESYILAGSMKTDE